MKYKKLALTTIALTCISCSHSTSPAPRLAAPASAGVVPAEAQGPVIVKIVSRDHTIVARAGTNGPVYSVENSTGEILMPSMTLDQMTALHPDFANRVKTMQATAWAGADAAR